MCDLLTSPYVEQLRAQRLAREGLLVAKAVPAQQPTEEEQMVALEQMLAKRKAAELARAKWYTSRRSPP